MSSGSEKILHPPPIRKYGPFFACEQCIRARHHAGGYGKITRSASGHEEIPRAGSAGYCASKGGLRMLTRCLRLELAPDHIDVNLKRAAKPWEIAKLALSLASKDSESDSGSSLTFTLGGELMMNQGQGG